MVARNPGIPAQLLLAAVVGIGSFPALLFSAIVVDKASAQDVDTNKETPTPSPKPAPGGALLLPGEGAQLERLPRAILEHDPLAPARSQREPDSNDAKLPTPRGGAGLPEHEASRGVRPPQPPVKLDPLNPPHSPGD